MNDVVQPILYNNKEEVKKLSNLPMEAINRCFSGNTMEEIEDCLKRENSEWANEILKIFEKKSLLSLKVD